MAIGIKVNKFTILYIVNERHDETEHKNQQYTGSKVIPFYISNVKDILFLYFKHQSYTFFYYFKHQSYTK
jgi:hypothetical protein